MKTEALIALPVFNEAKHLPDVLLQLLPYQARTLFVNDGSTDSSSALIRSAGFYVVDFPVNQGLSAVYRAVFAYATANDYQSIVFLDSDGQHEVANIPAFEIMVQHSNMVCGNRFWDTDHVPKAKIASNLFAILLHKEITGFFVPDVACGFRAFRKTDNWPKIGGSFGYEVIYNTLLSGCLNNDFPEFIRVKAIYDHRSEYFTRSEEVESLLVAMGRFDKNGLIVRLKEQFSTGSDLKIKLSGLDFHAVKSNGHYIFSTDDQNARQIFKDINKLS